MEVPAQLKILDYKKPPKAKKQASRGPMIDFFDETEVGCDEEIESNNSGKHSLPSQEIQYPKVRGWLETCTLRPDRNQDGHNYLLLAEVLEGNEMTRLDDVVNLTASEVIDLAKDHGQTVSRGLANRIIAYAKADVEQLKGKGRERG